jgi:hypothetical protein
LDNNSDNKQNSIEQKNRKSGYMIFFAGCCFIFSILLTYIYSYSPYTFSIAGYELKKLNLNPYDSLNENEFIAEFTDTLKHNSILPNDTINLSNSANVLIDSINAISKSALDSFVVVHQPTSVCKDSTKHRVMIMGDSECGGLCHQLNKYCAENKHELVATVVWNSATIYNFGYADTIEKLLNKFNPTYVFFVVGLNELHAKDLNKRKDAAVRLLSKIKRFPYTWIGPANYMDDKGINKVFESINDTGSFFLTKGMNLPKGTDGRHPSSEGYQLWMDSIANWMNVKAKHKIAMLRPVKKYYPFKSRMLIFNAAKYRGY